MLALEFAALLHLDVRVLPGAQVVARPVCKPGQTCPAARFGSVGEHELDVRVRPLGRAVIATFPGGEDRAHQIDVREARHSESPSGASPRSARPRARAEYP